MSNPNTVNMSFPTAVKIQSAYECSWNKDSKEMTLEDIRVLNPSLSVYLLKKANVLEEDNVVACIRVNIPEAITLDVDNVIAKGSDELIDVLVLTKNLEKIKEHIEKELVRLHLNIEDKRNG